MSWLPQLGQQVLPSNGESYVAPAVSSIRPQYIITTPPKYAVDHLGAPPSYGTTVPYMLEPWGFGTDASLGVMVGWSMAAAIYAASMWGLCGYGCGAPLYSVYR